MSKHHRGISSREWARLRRACFDRDGWRCVACGKPGVLEAHHVNSLASGGSNALGNLATLCRGCHIRTHRTVERDPWTMFAAELLTGV